mmetsp:Transcript_139311/g.277824  ORF Transcript_139311/g.277824 Transcript_139311/m.277824 type:complete len:255 (-) Transcript_139311:70-834(-)
MGCGCGKAQAGQVHAATSAKDPLSARLAATSKGKFQSALPPDGEGRRDFARIFFANHRKIWFIAKGMPSMRPLQPTTGPSSAHIGDLSEQVVERAELLFSEILSAQLAQVCGGAPPSENLDVNNLRSRAMAAMTVNVGVDFAMHMNLMPTFLQPLFLIVILGDMAEARAATYGFIAATPQQIEGKCPESKRTPFCVRLLSPNLLANDENGSGVKKWEVDYSVREVRCASIMQAAQMDEPKMREAIASATWDPIC